MKKVLTLLTLTLAFTMVSFTAIGKTPQEQLRSVIISTGNVNIVENKRIFTLFGWVETTYDKDRIVRAVSKADGIDKLYVNITTR